MKLPKVEIVHRGRGADDPTPYQADIWYEDGTGNYHAVGATPAEALRTAALFWSVRDKRQRGPDEALDEAKASA